MPQQDATQQAGQGQPTGPADDTQAGVIDALPPPVEEDSLREAASVGLIAVGTVMMLVVILRMLRRTAKNQQTHASQAAARQPIRVQPQAESGARERLERVTADAEELTRRLAAILDNKAAKIEVLLDRAEAQAELLESMIARVDQVGAHSARSTPDAPTENQFESAVSANATLANDPLHRRVYELADRGLEPVEIAREIDRPTGQIELILALRRV